MKAGADFTKIDAPLEPEDNHDDAAGPSRSSGTQVEILFFYLKKEFCSAFV